MIMPLRHINSENDFDIFVNVNGGGKTGQAEAISLLFQEH